MTVFMCRYMLTLLLGTHRKAAKEDIILGTHGEGGVIERERIATHGNTKSEGYFFSSAESVLCPYLTHTF